MEQIGQIRWVHANSRETLQEALLDRHTTGLIADVRRSSEVFTDVMALREDELYDLSFNQWIDLILAGSKHEASLPAACTYYCAGTFSGSKAVWGRRVDRMGCAHNCCFCCHRVQSHPPDEPCPGPC